jgi:endothelin-converting enzyme/putative endopeptidase
MINMNRIFWRLAVLSCLLVGWTFAQTPSATPSKQELILPYTPSPDLAPMDKTADPCVNFYQYSCGGWKKNNAIPPDQTSWSIYAKLYQDNLLFLRGILEQASIDNGQRDVETRQIGDFYAACMDEASMDKQGIAPVRNDLDAVSNLQSAKELAPLVARLQQAYGGSLLSHPATRLDESGNQGPVASQTPWNPQQDRLPGQVA